MSKFILCAAIGSVVILSAVFIYVLIRASIENAAIYMDDSYMDDSFRWGGRDNM